MATDNILRTYGDSAAKEDVLGLVEILTARETWFLNNLGKSTAINTIHITLTDTLATAGSSAVAEAGSLTANALTTTTRLTNIVEKIARPFKVDATQQLIQHYYGEDELARQTTKALQEWGNDAEFDIVRSTLVSGVSGTVPKMSGIIEATSLAKNHTSHSSGTVWSASILNGLMKANWDNSNGDVSTNLFMGSFLRDATDAFTQKSNSLVNVQFNEIDKSVDLYSTSFGRLMIHTHRYVQQSGDATGRVLSVRPEMLKIAFLRRPFVRTDLARDGDFDFRSVLGDLTLEVRNQESHFFADGFDID